MNNEQLRPCPNCQKHCIDWQKFNKNTPYICQSCDIPIKAKPMTSIILMTLLPISTLPIFLYAKTKSDLFIGLGLTLILLLAIHLLSEKFNALFCPLYVDKK